VDPQAFSSFDRPSWRRAVDASAVKALMRSGARFFDGATEIEFATVSAIIAVWDAGGSVIVTYAAGIQRGTRL
jgi:hypothetical protein